MTKAGQWGWNVEFEDASSPLYIPFVRPSFPALSGMLSLALFLHNCVVAIMKNNRHPENNVNFYKYFLIYSQKISRVTFNYLNFFFKFIHLKILKRGNVPKENVIKRLLLRYVHGTHFFVPFCTGGYRLDVGILTGTEGITHVPDDVYEISR